MYVQFSSHQELTTMEQNTQGRGDEVFIINFISFCYGDLMKYIIFMGLFVNCMCVGG